MLTFQDMYDTHAKEVYRFAYWLAGSKTEAEGITSETFIRAWVRRTTVRTETLKAYLFAIARNILLERERKRKRLVVLEDVHPDPAPGPEVQVERRQAARKVLAVLRTLPEIDRAAFLLRVRHELPYIEIARVLGISLASARVKVHRIRKKLLSVHMDKEVR